MIKNIQNHLLVNQPTLWNTRLIPMLLLTVAIQTFFFIITYFATDTSILYSEQVFSGTYYLLYAGSVLVSILVLIFWLLQYNRNNATRVFYPQSVVTLYIEWLCIFAICIFIAFIPNSLSIAKTTKWKSTITQAEQQAAVKIINEARALLASNVYYFELDGNQQPLMVGNADVDRSKFDTKLFNYEENATTPDNPIEYVGPSYLYYKDNYRNSYWDESDEVPSRVNRWLIQENKDSIRAVMESFLDLQSKHKLKTNVDVDYWMKTVFNPPLYPVTDLIATDEYTTTYSKYGDDDYSNGKYVSLDQLSRYYYEAGSYYGHDGFNKWYIVVTLIIALGISVMVFSSRMTSGRYWIFALLSSGVIIFIFSLLAGMASLISSNNFGFTMPIFWLILFAVIACLLGIKIAQKEKKGKSNIYINLAIWMIPAIIPWIYQLIVFLDIIEEGRLVDSMLDNTYIMLIVNLIFTTVMMFPAILLIRKWKALPED